MLRVRRLCPGALVMSKTPVAFSKRQGKHSGTLKDSMSFGGKGIADSRGYF